MYRKTIYSIIAALFFVPGGTIAQDITPSEGLIVYRDAPRACWEVHVDPEPKTLKKAWQDYIKDDFDVKMKGIGFLTNRDLLSAEEVVVRPVSPEPINFYTHIVEDVNGSELKLFSELKPGEFASGSEHSRAFRAMRDILEDFLAEYLPIYYQSRVKDAEQRMVELADEREDLKKNIARDSDKISELEHEIEQRRLDLQTNQDKLDLAESKLEARKKKLERIRELLK
ncbi:MAG: hypothetical protein ACWGNV_01115 [Bacteroidales bacterium]